MEYHLFSFQCSFSLSVYSYEIRNFFQVNCFLQSKTNGSRKLKHVVGFEMTLFFIVNFGCSLNWVNFIINFECLHYVRLSSELGSYAEKCLYFLLSVIYGKAESLLKRLIIHSFFFFKDFFQL